VIPELTTNNKELFLYFIVDSSVVEGVVRQFGLHPSIIHYTLYNYIIMHTVLAVKIKKRFYK
jgi:hypothetical protein